MSTIDTLLIQIDKTGRETLALVHESQVVAATAAANIRALQGQMLDVRDDQKEYSRGSSERYKALGDRVSTLEREAPAMRPEPPIGEDRKREVRARTKMWQKLAMLLSGLAGAAVTAAAQSVAGH